MAFDLGIAIRQANLPWFIPKECLIRVSNETGYEPDIVVLDEAKLSDESGWERQSVITNSSSIKLAIEVVSTNWRDDYLLKLADYETFGIQEYWIVDYLGLGGRRYIGSPKQPTITVCTLMDGEYELQQFRAGDVVISPILPGLSLAVDALLR